MNKKRRQRFTIKSILIVFFLVSVVLTVFTLRTRSYVKIQELHIELERQLNDAAVKNAFKAAGPSSFAEIENDFWVVIGPNGLRAKEASPTTNPIRQNHNSSYVFDIGSPTCHLYLEVSRPWQIQLASPSVVIEYFEGEPYETLADYVEFVLEEKFASTDVKRILIEP
jgi:hypothetical protein